MGVSPIHLASARRSLPVEVAQRLAEPRRPARSGPADDPVDQVLLLAVLHGRRHPPVAAHVLQHRRGSPGLTLGLAVGGLLHPPPEDRGAHDETQHDADDPEVDRWPIAAPTSTSTAMVDHDATQDERGASSGRPCASCWNATLNLPPLLGAGLGSFLFPRRSSADKWSHVRVQHDAQGRPKMLPLVLGSVVITSPCWCSSAQRSATRSTSGHRRHAGSRRGRRDLRAAGAEDRLQPGRGSARAAAAVLQNMRGNWRVTPAVQYSKEQDLVHRVIGRPGIVLVGEAPPPAAQPLRQRAASARQVDRRDAHLRRQRGRRRRPGALRRLDKHMAKLPATSSRPSSTTSTASSRHAGSRCDPEGRCRRGLPRGKMR